MTWTLSHERITRHASIGGGSVMLWCVRDERGHIVASNKIYEVAIGIAIERAKDWNLEVEIEETE